MQDAATSGPAKTKDSSKSMKASSSEGAAEEKKKFEVKKVSPLLLKDRHSFTKMDLKWNAVALWAWDIVVDNCAICRNHIMDLCTFAIIPSKRIRFANLIALLYRYRMSSKSRLIYNRRMYGSVGDLQCGCLRIYPAY